ncbi:MAG TPA: HD domain-containing phosphohydrolase, partial [Clostridia bacterium]
MRLVAIKDLKPGMKVAKNVQLDDGRLLILSGFIINSGYIRKLEVFNVPHIYIKEEVKISEGVSDKKVYAESSDTIKSVMTSLRDGIAINSVELKEKVNDIVSEILANDTVFMQLSGIKDRDNYTYLHSIDVCIYSLIAGKNLGLNADELLELGISAALHDIGKSKVPMEVLMKPGKLTPEEFEQMKMHPLYSREIISSMKVFSERIADISSQHHEKLDGSGYPYGLKCRDIDFFARIIS